MLRAQTIMMSDMMSLINLPEDEAKGYLNSKGFKLKIISQVDGFTVNQFEITQAGKQETVVYGQNSKAVDGTVLHTIRYSTNSAQYITNLIANAKKSGLQMDFQGNDNYKNIYFFNSTLYRASIFLNFNKAYGLVEIREKDLSGG
ncbi:hypothetical protein GCM10027037_09020 [Mucilaginibacter koreensis]